MEIESESWMVGKTIGKEEQYIYQKCPPLDGHQKFLCLVGRRFGGDEVGRRYVYWYWLCIIIIIMPFSGLLNTVKTDSILQICPHALA